MDNEVESSLRGDPKRQAIASLQGYAYQIWQSLYRWLHLRTDQALVLEGAEDIDLMGLGKASNPSEGIRADFPSVKPRSCFN